MNNSLELIADLGFALLLGSVIVAIVLRVRQRRRKSRMPPARLWWIAPTALTAAFLVSTIIRTLQDFEAGGFWGAFWVIFLPLLWGAALTVRLLWHFVRPLLLRRGKDQGP
jgi:hypothetical protein